MNPTKQKIVIVATGARPFVPPMDGFGGPGTFLFRTSDRNIFAVGECVEHRGKLYSPIDPIWDQAKVLADVIAGFDPKAESFGSKLGTKLKVMGVELASMGETRHALPDDEVVRQQGRDQEGDPGRQVQFRLQGRRLHQGRPGFAAQDPLARRIRGRTESA